MSDAGQRVRWDRSAARQVVGVVAVANAQSDRIVLSFGTRRGEDQPGREQGVTLTQRIALHPMTAKHLHDMLSRLLAEAAANPSAPQGR